MSITSCLWNPTSYAKQAEKLPATEEQKKILEIADRESKKTESAKFLSVTSAVATIAAYTFGFETVLIPTFTITYVSAIIWIQWKDDVSGYNRRAEMTLLDLRAVAKEQALKVKSDEIDGAEESYTTEEEESSEEATKGKIDDAKDAVVPKSEEEIASGIKDIETTVQKSETVEKEESTEGTADDVKDAVIPKSPEEIEPKTEIEVESIEQNHVSVEKETQEVKEDKEAEIATETVESAKSEPEGNPCKD